MKMTITKNTSVAIQEFRKRMASIINLLPDATIVINLEGQVIAWNRAIEEMTGVKAEDMLGKGNYEYALPFYGIRRPILADFILRPEELNEKLYRYVRHEENSAVIEVDGLLVKGKDSYMWAKAAPLYDEDGQMVGAIESIRDITERKQMEIALKNSEQRLSDIINFLPDAILVIDLEGKVIAWNRAIEEMTGVKAEDMLGKGDYEYALPFYGVRRPLLADLVLTSNEAIEKEYFYIKKEKDILEIETDIPRIKGRQAFFWAKAAPLFDSQGKLAGAVESIRDITERKRTEAQLRYISFRDPVTGFYNRAYFLEELRRFESGRYSPAGLLICALEGLSLSGLDPEREDYKLIITEITNLIRMCVCQNDILTSRIGNNEFAVLFSHCMAMDIKNLSSQILDKIQEYNDCHPDSTVQVSIGFAIQSEDTAKMEDLFKEASNNLYRNRS
jgi:PAS domain-containing protein